jgi:hypothetical protein
MPCRTLLALAAGAAVLVAPLAAQDVPRRPLGRPAATFPEPVSNPVGFRALDDQRVIVADPLEGAVSLLDFHAGTVTRIGRQGEGPGEYGMPGQLFAAGDTTFMLDMGNRRLLAITADGRILANSVPLSHPSGAPILPRGVDAQGRVYFDFAGIAMPGLQESARTGRAPLIRWDRKATRFDTVATVQFPPMTPAGPGEVRVLMGGGAYQPRDDWTVLPDGRIGLARATEYRVEWLGAATPVVGPAVKYDPVKVGDDEKNAWADQVATRGMVVEVRDGQRRTGRPPRPDIAKMTWPDVMPPFTGTRAVLAAPNGELWVRRAQPARAPGTLYDVFDGRGRLVRQVTLDGNRVVIGFGPGSVFVARTDEDDLQWIERYANRRLQIED